jgi:hypothetical protein
MQNEKAYELVTTGLPEKTRPSLRNGFNGVLRALPGDRACLPPSQAQCASIVANLTPASGRQDHTASPSANRCSRQQHHPRPPHPAPNVRDDREPPLLRERDGDQYASDLGFLKIRIFLREGLDTPLSDLPVGQVGSVKIMVVPAKAGTHTPRQVFWEPLFDGFRATPAPCGYGSLRSQGRRERWARRPEECRRAGIAAKQRRSGKRACALDERTRTLA